MMDYLDLIDMSSNFQSIRVIIFVTWQGVRPGQIRKGATRAVVGWLVGESGPKSVGGSSWIELGTRREWQGHSGFRLVQASEE
jgi:hypothetical protein